MKTDLLTLAKAEFFLILYMLPFLLASWYVIYRWGRKTLSKDQEAEYKLQYEWISFILDFGNPTTILRDHLEKEIQKLEAMTYKNPEMTDVLKNRFLEKFKELVKVENGCPFDEPVYNPDQKIVRKAEEKILSVSN